MKGRMQSFSGSDFLLDGSDGFRMIFDMKGGRSLYFKLTGNQAYNQFCRGVLGDLEDASMRDFVIEMLFSGLGSFSMNKLHGGERTGGVPFCELPVGPVGKKRIRFCFFTGENTLICMRFAYTHVTMRIK